MSESLCSDPVVALDCVTLAVMRMLAGGLFALALLPEKADRPGGRTIT
jgi:hypothetical protein